MKGILGINARNLLYIKPYNKKKAIRLADDKLKTKHFLSARGIPVPKLYGVIRDKEELEKFDFSALPGNFALKPNFGFGGEGIIVIANKRESYWVSESGKKYREEDFKNHILDIIDGRYSIANFADWAFFEQLIVSHGALKPFAQAGLPDIRIVVHNLIPVMAMLRIPTEESDGKANIHLGGIGVGLDIAKGEATHIVHKNKIIEEIPGIGPIKGVQIPFWDEILMIASKVQLITNLGYLAADIAIDHVSGPVLLEINARAGLSVQIANLAPLRKRLERIEGVKVTTPEKGVRIAKDMFGNVVQKQIKEMSGKEIVGTEETIELLVKKETVHVPALIDNTIERSFIDKKLAEKLNLLTEENDYDPVKKTLKLKFTLSAQRIQTVVEVTDIQLNSQFIVGRRDLADFLIDPSKKQIQKSLSAIKEIEKQVAKQKSVKPNYYEVDQKLMDIDRKLKVIHQLKPTNLAEEKKKFFKNFAKNPIFNYPEFKHDFDAMRKKLRNIETDSLPLGMLFEKKKKELADKLHLIEHIGTADITEYSRRLYGESDEKLLIEAEKRFKYLPELKLEGSIVNAEEAKKSFEKKIEEYGLKNWKVQLKENMVSDCSAGKESLLFIKKEAKFSEERIRKLIAHELEVHILTAENGKYQPYEIFNRGTAGYLETQEGLAIIVQNKALSIPFEMSFLASDAVIAVDRAREGDFIDVFEKLLSLGIAMERAWNLSVKVKRGLSDTSQKGGFTKELIYARGATKVHAWLEQGNDIRELYIGKITLDDLPTIKKIPDLVPPKHIPKWLGSLIGR